MRIIFEEVGVNVGKEIDESVCEESPLVENLWLVDGTGSYQGYRNKAKEEFVKNWNYLKQKATGRVNCSSLSFLIILIKIIL